MRYDRARPRRSPQRTRYHRRSVPRRRSRRRRRPLTGWQRFQRYLDSTIFGATVPTQHINIWLAMLGILYLLIQLIHGNP